MEEINLKDIKQSGDQLEISIDGKNYKFIFYYNDWYDYWVMDCYLEDSEEPFLTGIKIIPFQDIFGLFRGNIEKVPISIIQFINITDNNANIVKKDDMKDEKVIMCVLTQEDVLEE